MKTITSLFSFAVDASERKGWYIKLSYQIIGDSCCDYCEEYDGLRWLERVPLTIELDGVRYVDDNTFDRAAFVQRMAKSSEAPKTAAPSAGDFLDMYERCGADETYVITLSERLSATYSSAMIAAEMYREAHPDRKIHVFNSRSASSGEIAICLRVRELAETGMAFEEVVARTEAFIVGQTTFFVLETLDVFRKNGRLNHLQALVTNALRVKLVMGGDSDGNVCVRGKALSTEQALAKMVGMIKEICKGGILKSRVLVISNVECRERAIRVRDKIMEACSFCDAIVCDAGGITTTFANDGGITLSF